MADQWVDVEDEWVDAPEGEPGQPGHDPYKKGPYALVPKEPVVPSSRPDDPAEEKRKMAMAVAGMTGGQNLASLPPEKQEEMQLKSAAGALGEGIATARGVPFVGSHIDELSAALQSGALGGPKYDSKRQEARGAVNQAVADNPSLPLVGTMAFAPAMPSAAAWQRLAGSTLAGASEGVGVAPTLKDAPRGGLIGGAAGLGAGLVGEMLGAGGRSLGGKAQKLSDTTHAASLKAETEAREAAVKSAIGSEGGVTASAMKMWDRLEDALTNPAASPQSRAAAQAFINSPEGQALYNQVLSNYASDAPRQMGRLSTARAARTAAEAANDPALIQAAAQAAADAKLNDLSGVTNRLTEMGRRYIPPAIGTAVGGAPGAAAGAMVAGSMGRPGTLMSNMLKSPSMYLPLRAGEAALGGAGAGVAGSAPAMSRVALDRWAKFLEPEPQPELEEPLPPAVEESDSMADEYAKRMRGER